MSVQLSAAQDGTYPITASHVCIFLTAQRRVLLFCNYMYRANTGLKRDYHCAISQLEWRALETIIFLFSKQKRKYLVIPFLSQTTPLLTTPNRTHFASQQKTPN